MKNEINKNRSKEPAEIADQLKVEPRKSVYIEEKNRYENMVEERKKEKRDRDEEKLKKPHIGNKGHVEKLVKAEAERDFLESPTEKEMEEELKEESSEKLDDTEESL